MRCMEKASPAGSMLTVLGRTVDLKGDLNSGPGFSQNLLNNPK